MKNKSKTARRGFFVLFALLYLTLFLAIYRTPYYNVIGAHSDRLFSADDPYYVTEIFSAEPDDSPRIVKHPLLIVFGSLFTRLEQALLGFPGFKRHYGYIVLFQIACSLLSTWYLDRILEEQYRVGTRRALLLCAIYACAFSTLFYTFVAESYILSSLLLMMSFYHARRGHTAVVIVLGAFAAGVTITNAALWALIVVCTGGARKRTAVTLLLGGALFCLLVAVSSVRDVFFRTLVSTGLNSARDFSDRFGVLETLRRVFFSFFGSTAFYLDTAAVSPFGEFAGDALSFLPSAPLPIAAAMLLWCALLVCAVVAARRDSRLLAPLAVLCANLVLHGVIGYGLKEAFLYSLHHFGAQILLVALLFRDSPACAAGKKQRWAESALALYLLCILLLNIPGYRELGSFMIR